MWLLIWFFVGAVATVHGGAVKFIDGKDTPTYTTYKDTDLSYSDLDSIYHESKERLYRNFRDYGVPSDVAQVYVPRGMTIGELFGKQSKKNGENVSNVDNDQVITSTFDPWSVVWYIGSFGGLIAFFLVVSCSEWCCLRNRAAQQAQTRRAPQGACATHHARTAAVCTETPPPAYHLFAPPPYDSVTYGEKTEKYDVFVVPVHAVGPNFIQAAPVQADAPPPEYSSVTMPLT